MKSIGKSMLATVAAVGLMVMHAMAQEHNTPEVFKSDVTMDKGSKMHVNGSWDIGGTVITATPASINLLNDSTTSTNTGSLLVAGNLIVSSNITASTLKGGTATGVTNATLAFSMGAAATGTASNYPIALAAAATTTNFLALPAKYGTTNGWILFNY